LPSHGQATAVAVPLPRRHLRTQHARRRALDPHPTPTPRRRHRRRPRRPRPQPRMRRRPPPRRSPTRTRTRHRHPATRRTHQPLPSTLLVMDEAGNTPTRWLPPVASTCAAIGILLVTIWQSRAQIDAAYGSLADSVLTNHGTKIIFSGASDLATLRYASELLGTEEVPETTRQTDSNGRVVTASGVARLPLLPPDLLR